MGIIADLLEEFPIRGVLEKRVGDLEQENAVLKVKVMMLKNENEELLKENLLLKAQIQKTEIGDEVPVKSRKARESEELMIPLCLRGRNMHRIKQKISSFMVIAVLVCFCPLIKSENREAANIVKNLGRSKAAIDEVISLKNHYREAIPLLINELHAVDKTGIGEGEINHPTSLVDDAQHVLWCIRALCFLTGGKEFCAPTKYKFGKSEDEKNRKYFLHVKCSLDEESKETDKDKDYVAYFKVWLSRGYVYIAPLDAQEKIIECWRSWYKNHGKSSYEPLKGLKSEFAIWLW